MAQPIDAVVTWVNGDDPAHQARLQTYLQTLGKTPSTANANRFRETGEFAYCIASLLRFAPWLRRIHVVTDQQAPEFMPMLAKAGLEERVQIVDHRIIFRDYEACLPTFNIRSIISVLWRIPELAERFIFLNDDFMLLQPVQPEDFFRDDKMVVRGHWAALPWQRWDRYVLGLLGLSTAPEEFLKRPGNREAQARSAALVGYQKRYFRVPHNPHPMLRSLISEWAEKNPQALAQNVSYRLRSSDQFLMDALVTHLAIQSGRAVIDNRLKTLRLRMDALSLAGFQRKVRWAGRLGNRSFACLQSLEQASPDVQRAAMTWLEKTVGSLAVQCDQNRYEGELRADS